MAGVLAVLQYCSHIINSTSLVNWLPVKNLTAHYYGASLPFDRLLIRNMTELLWSPAKLSINLYI